MSRQSGIKAVLAAAAANTFIAATKFGAWMLTGASSLLAEAIHSVADTSNQVLLLLGGKAANRQADDKHPFGYGRERYLSAFLVSVVLFSLGGVFALYETWHKWQETLAGHPNELLTSQWWWVPLAVLGIATIAEGFSLRTALTESHKARGNQSLFRFIKTSRSPELPVILLEDVAALVGLIFAFVGVGLSVLTNNPLFDLLGTALIGLLLIAVALVLAIETKSMLIGEPADSQTLAQMRIVINETEGVVKLIELKSLHLGPEEILVVVRIAISPLADANQIVELINSVQDRIRVVEPNVTQLFVEPDFCHSQAQRSQQSQETH